MPITAPTINWRFSPFQKICNRIKFSDIFEEQCQKSPTAGSCQPLALTLKDDTDNEELH